jgi:hypothetical protein
MRKRKILRKMYKPVTEKGVWIVTTNQGLSELGLYRIPDMVATTTTPWLWSASELCRPIADIKIARLQ